MTLNLRLVGRRARDLIAWPVVLFVSFLAFLALCALCQWDEIRDDSPVTKE